MPSKKLVEMKTEAEEARWFEDNQDRLLELFEQAEKKGGLRVGGKSIGITLSKKTETVRKPPCQKVMLRIPSDDISPGATSSCRQGDRLPDLHQNALARGTGSGGSSPAAGLSRQPYVKQMRISEAFPVPHLVRLIEGVRFRNLARRKTPYSP